MKGNIDMDRPDHKLMQHLPLQPAELHILLALGGGEMHGYAIMQQVVEETEGQVRLGPGTLYVAIRRLCNSGFIAEARPPADAGHSAERRRYYRLSPLGRRLMAAELQRLAKVVRAGVSYGLLKQDQLSCEGLV